MLTNFGELPIEIQIFPFQKIIFKVPFAKWNLFCSRINLLMCIGTFFGKMQFICWHPYAKFNWHVFMIWYLNLCKEPRYKLLSTDIKLCFLHITWFYLLSVSLTIFHHNSNVIEISCFYRPNSNESIVAEFRTLHGSCVVLECVNICGNIIARNGDTVNRNVY